MSTAGHDPSIDAPSRLPALAWVIVAAVGVALAGGLYLIAVRGESLLVDLAGMARTMLCL